MIVQLQILNEIRWDVLLSVIFSCFNVDRRINSKFCSYTFVYFNRMIYLLQFAFFFFSPNSVYSHARILYCELFDMTVEYCFVYYIHIYYITTLYSSSCGNHISPFLSSEFLKYSLEEFKCPKYIEYLAYKLIKRQH